MKLLYLILIMACFIFLPACSGQGGPSSPETQSPTVGQVPTLSPTPSPPQLKQTVTCTDAGGFTESSNVSFAHSVNYVVSTYSDASIKITCSFSALSVNTHPSGGTCNIPIDANGTSNDSIPFPYTPCGFGTQAGFFNGLSCPISNPYTYSFNVQALPGEGWSALNPTGTITMSECVAVNY